MFTGLVESMGQVTQLIPEGPGVRLTVKCPIVADGVAMGASISINGCCLTVIAIDGEALSFEAGEETLSKTNLGKLKQGSLVNLERSLQVGDRLGGHFVSGHVDAVGTIDERIDDEEWSTIFFKVPSRLTKQMASKGSVAVDGISLTLVDVEAERFSVALIPHTLDVTTLGQHKVGDQVNIETDLLAKYVEKQLQGESDS
ncbi:MAG: riboflavin synthase [Pirellulales bacterium]